jgi:hypothetical protein
LLRKCLTIYQQKLPGDWKCHYTQSQLGGCLLGQKKYAEAETLLRAGHEGLRAREQTIPAGAKKCFAEALERLVQVYDALGKPDDAAKWRRELETAKSR